MEYASSSWTNRSIMNAEGTVAGTVTTRKGGVLPLTVRLVYEQGTWKVLALEPVGATRESTEP
jgi:hypothetical protein